MTPEQRKHLLELEIRLQTMEYVICLTGKLICSQLGGAKYVEGLRKDVRHRLASETFEGAPPEWGDHMSAEIAEAVDTLLKEIQDGLFDM